MRYSTLPRFVLKRPFFIYQKKIRYAIFRQIKMVTKTNRHWICTCNNNVWGHHNLEFPTCNRKFYFPIIWLKFLERDRYEGVLYLINSCGLLLNNESLSFWYYPELFHFQFDVFMELSIFGWLYTKSGYSILCILYY